MDAGSKVEATKYVKVHYGDWPEKAKEVPSSEGEKIGFVYYEYLEDREGKEDKTFYYHGWIGTRGVGEEEYSEYEEVFTEGKGLKKGLNIQEICM